MVAGSNCLPRQNPGTIVSFGQILTIKYSFMKSFLPVLILSVFISCQTPDQKPTPQNPAVPHAPEEEAIKKAIDNAYNCISFKKGEKVNYDDVKNYFMPQAQMFNFRNDTLEMFTISQFVDLFRDFIESNGITSFYEEEIQGTTDQFGRVAQRISTYKTYINTMDSIAERGVNSFQLVKTPQGWKVSSIIWDVESSRLKIPDYYLNKDNAK
jgi:hypothetical protein